MSFIRNSKKALKFTFVTMPMHTFGVSQLLIGNRQISDLWHSINGVVCPACKSGTLLCKKDAPNSADQPLEGQQKKEVLYPWMCTNCDFALLGIANTRVIKNTVRELLRKDAVEQLGEMEIKVREQRARYFIIRSRVFFLFGFGSWAYCFYQFSNGGSLLFSAYFLSFGMASVILGLKASYRAWQVETGTIFVEGAFVNWLKHERWFR